MRDDTKNGCVADYVDNDLREASFVHYEALFRVRWGKGVCMSLWSEFQIGLFHVLKHVAVVTP